MPIHMAILLNRLSESFFCLMTHHQNCVITKFERRLTTDYPAAILLLAIQQLRCLKCRTRMKLARISPGPTGFELRTFDCAKCDHVEQIAIASDPMKSGDAGWLVGDFYPSTKRI